MMRFNCRYDLGKMFTADDWGFNEPDSLRKEDDELVFGTGKIRVTGKQINTSLFEEAEVVI